MIHCDSATPCPSRKTRVLTSGVCVCLGSTDTYSLPEAKGQASKAGEMPMYVNTQQIDAQVLAVLQAEAEHASDAKISPQKDLFDMSTSWLGHVTG